MQLRSYIKFSGILALIAGTVVIGLAVFLPRLLDINSYRDEIFASLQQSLNRKVTFKNGAFAWHFGPSFDFTGVVVKEPDGTSDFLTAERITVKLALLPLLEKQIVLQDVRADGADIHLVRNNDNSLNIDDLLKPSKGSVPLQFKRIQLRRSSVQWRDMTVHKEGFSAQARDISLDLDHLARGRKGEVTLSGTLPALSGKPGSLTLSGSLNLPAAGQPLTGTEVNGSIDVKQFDIGRFWPYYKRFIPFDNSGGRLDLASSFKGRVTEFGAKGKIQVSGAAVVWPKIFNYTVAPKSLQLAYDLRLSPTQLDIPTLELAADTFRVKASVRVDDYAGKDPRIVAKASTPTSFRYEDVKSFVPYGIIPPNTSEYIEHKIKSGTFRLETGTLDGRLSQIAHMELGDNSKVLYIRAPVEKAVLSYGPKAPVFSNIKGTIELKDKDFHLLGVTALFGESPLRMHGSITEYNTDKYSDYPVHMEITPHPPEVAWLARIAGADKLEFGGNSTLVLDGSGHFSAYNLKGAWELKPAAYTFPGAIRKPTGMANQLNFTSIVSGGQTKLTSLSYTLQSLSLSATALLKYRDQSFLDFELQTNSFLLNDTLPILTGWQQYHPRGKVQVRLHGIGNPEDFSAMNYAGSVALTAFSLQPGEKLKSVSGINGSITFKGNSLETSSMAARYGDSPLTVKGQMKSLKTGEAELAFNSPGMLLRDINLAPPKSETAIRRMNGVVSVREGRYTVNSFSGLLNNSNFSISGIYAGGASPENSFTITSSSLDVDDLLLLAHLGRPVPAETGGQSAPKGSLKIKLAAEAGKYGRIPFTKLNVTAQQESGVIYLQSLDAGTFGGRLTAKGRVAPSGGQGDRYDLNFSLERVDAERFLHALDLSREVTGSLNVQGDVTARGDSMADIKKTALGNVRLRLEKGSLRKFNVFSKMFSILNVSQLLKGRLPDMVTVGMPFNDIKGSFAISDGVVNTQDLFINSDAMNISVIGTANLVREDLNFTIGVQPLQTVDKVINRIPVVGWLLTGKDKDLVTVYFEAKGKWADPHVTAIPAKSLGKGLLNVFRRVFELPVRLFTDTGEVILGK